MAGRDACIRELTNVSVCYMLVSCDLSMLSNGIKKDNLEPSPFSKRDGFFRSVLQGVGQCIV